MKSVIQMPPRMNGSHSCRNGTLTPTVTYRNPPMTPRMTTHVRDEADAEVDAVATLGRFHLEDDRRDRIETRGLDGHGLSLDTAQGRHLGAPAVRTSGWTSRSPTAWAAPSGLP